MKTLPLPPDGGLKKPVRKFEDTFSVWEVLMKHFFPEEYEKEKNGTALNN